MFNSIKKILAQKEEEEYKPYNMIICKHEFRKNLCKCKCHNNVDIVHFTPCCSSIKCPDCNQVINVK